MKHTFTTISVNIFFTFAYICLRLVPVGIVIFIEPKTRAPLIAGGRNLERNKNSKQGDFSYSSPDSKTITRHNSNNELM